MPASAPDPAYDLWDFSDPAGSEARFREAAEEHAEPVRSVLLTQAARALGLQGRYAEAHALLDGLAPDDPEVGVRVDLERGRLHRSAGDDVAALPLFEAAAAVAARSGLEVLEVDALHMVALNVPAQEQVAAGYRALAIARSATDRRARDWDASLLNNIGMAHAEAGDWGAALAAFEDARGARERIGDDERTRVARWMVGWALRNLGHLTGAREVQQALKAELDALGLEDPHVDEELALLEPDG